MADRLVYVKEGRWFGEREVQAEGGGLPAMAGVGMLPLWPLSMAARTLRAGPGEVDGHCVSLSSLPSRNLCFPS